MNKKEQKSLKKIKETVDEIIEQISMNILKFSDYANYYQEYQKLKIAAKEAKTAPSRNMLKTYAVSLALALKDAQVQLITDIEESTYNAYNKELNKYLGIARRVRSE